MGNNLKVSGVSYSAAEKAAQKSVATEATKEKQEAIKDKKAKKKDAATQLNAVAPTKRKVSAHVSKAEAAAAASAKEGNLEAEQMQMKRDLQFVPQMAKKLSALKAGIKTVEKRDKYGLNIATAISRGLGQLRHG